MEIPGTQPEDIDIDLENNVLTVSGEKSEEREEPPVFGGSDLMNELVPPGPEWGTNFAQVVQKRCPVPAASRAGHKKTPGPRSGSRRLHPSARSKHHWHQQEPAVNEGRPVVAQLVEHLLLDTLITAAPPRNRAAEIGRAPTRARQKIGQSPGAKATAGSGDR